jgi:polyphosphate kinase
MFRNLSRRVEAAAPIDDRALRERLWEILDVSLRDRRHAWAKRPDDSYEQLRPQDNAPGPAALGTHAWSMEQARRRSSA